MKMEGNETTDDMQTLLDMGYEAPKAETALNEHPNNLQAALEFLIQEEETAAAVKGDGEEQVGEGNETGALKVVKSYICTDTGKVFRTMRDVQLYAERTGYANFEESDIEVPPLSKEEKAEKVRQLRKKIEERRQEREAAEKVSEIAREKERRRDGKQMAEIREQMQKQKRLNEISLIKREKEEEIRQRELLREEIAKDKGNRAADKARKEGRDPSAAYKEAFDKYLNQHVKKEKTPEERLDQLISAINVLDARKTVLETLKLMLSNIVKTPENAKFRRIRLNNQGFQKRLGKYRSGIEFFKAVGFEVIEDEEKFLVLEDDNINLELIGLGISKLDCELGL